MKKLIASILTLILTAVVVTTVVAHTGSISNQQNCETGTSVIAHLDSNVAPSASWAITINGIVVDSGSGPGPVDLGPYDAGFGAGSAVLTIVFNRETNTYTTSFGAVEKCVQETPTPSETPSETPSLPDTAMAKP